MMISVMSSSPSSPQQLPGSRLSRAEALARELEEEISAGLLTTGDRIGTKEQLRQRFNVAAATVNEAVKLLDTRGLIEARPGPGGGVFVAGPASRMRSGPLIMGFEWTEATTADYHEVRGALEPLICRHAARNHTDWDIRALQAILAKMQESLDNPQVYMRYNTIFHRRIAKLTSNAPLRSLYLTLLDFFERDLGREPFPAVLNPVNIDIHQELLNAIDLGEGPGLEAAMRRHDENRVSLGMFSPADASARTG
jgi:GntR family transcriptional regulator, transcriptional repressor for pyruvate dehydrogenase complex